MGALVKIVALLLVATTLSATRAAEATSPGSLPGFCDLAPDGTSNTWTGEGPDDDWEVAENWSDGAYPGVDGGGDEDVCIPDGATPFITSGQEQHLRTLDVASGAVVTVDQDSKLFLYGDQTPADPGVNQDSVVRPGGRVIVRGATLGGIARLHVLGTLVLQTNNGGASTTVLTRDCSYDTDGDDGSEYPGEEPCTSQFVSGPLTGDNFALEVDDSGSLDIRSVNVGNGVNIGDRTSILNRGLVRLRSGAYVAADHGTRLDLRPHRTAAAGTGTLRFEGDGGWLEGKNTADTGISTLSVIANQGLIHKSGGTGRALVGAEYTQPAPGKVAVASGALLLPTGFATPAFVDGGAMYGTGRCAEKQWRACALETTPTFPQSADLKVPGFDTSGANVTVRRLASKSTAADLGRPFEVHATSMQADRARPAIIRLRFDASVLNGKGWKKVAIYRKSGTAPYRLVRACLSTGRPPVGEVACVDRRGLGGSSRNVYSHGTGNPPDVIMVVRATRTSRWVGR